MLSDEVPFARSMLVAVPRLVEEPDDSLPDSLVGPVTDAQLPT